MKIILKKTWKIFKKILPVLIVVFLMWLFFIKPKDKIAVVKKVEVKNREVERTVSASGSIKSKNQVDLSFMVVGKISKINVSKGDVVKKGDLLAYVNPAVQLQTAQSYKDARDQVKRDIDLFVFDRVDQVDALGGTTEYEITLRKYNEQLSQAEASYQAQLSVLSNYYMYAPFDGTIVDISKEEGETAAAGATVIKLADLNNLVFEITVDQEDYGYLKEGLSVNVDLDAYENTTFSGVVGKLPLYASESSGSFEVDINIQNTQILQARLGMLGDAYIILNKSHGEVPSLVIGEYYFDENDDPYIWIEKDGVIKKYMLELGVEGDVYIEIKNVPEETIVIPISDKIDIKEGFKAKFNGK